MGYKCLGLLENKIINSDFTTGFNNWVADNGVFNEDMFIVMGVCHSALKSVKCVLSGAPSYACNIAQTVNRVHADCMTEVSVWAKSQNGTSTLTLSTIYNDTGGMLQAAPYQWTNISTAWTKYITGYSGFCYGMVISVMASIGNEDDIIYIDDAVIKSKNVLVGMNCTEV